MAKGKHAAALFEVIHSGKDRSGLLRTPKWWFKGRKEPDVSAPAPARIRGDNGESVSTRSALPTDPEMAARPAIVANPSPMDPTDPSAPELSAPARRTAGVDLKLDPNHQHITFRVSYTSAIVSGFALVVVVALAYVIGRHMSRGPSPAFGGPSTDQVRQGPVRSDVLNVTPNSGAGARAADVRYAEDALSSGNAAAVRQQQQQSQQAAQPKSMNVPTAQPPPTAPVSFNGKRTVNLNYVIIQSYPDQAGADVAVKALAESGVGATVEQGMRGYPASWYTVVGTDGFARGKGTDYDAYIERIMQISEKFARNKRSFKAFQPMGYKWDRP
jgi:hypothetical protein